MAVKKESFVTPNQILVNQAPHFAVGVLVSQSAGTKDDVTGKTIVKAGTPLAGDLDARTIPFTEATGFDTVAILQHDVDVTVSDENGSALLIGVVNVNRMDKETQKLITSEVKTAIPTVKLLKL